MPEQIQDKIISFKDINEYDISYPVIITRWEIKQVHGFNKQYLQVYFQKVSDNVRAFHFNVKCYSVFGEVVDEVAEISIDKVNEENVRFSKIVPLKSQTQKVEIYLQKCCLLDNSVIEPKGKQIVSNSFVPFNEEDKGAGKRLLPIAKGYPVDNVNHWYCACGTLNLPDSNECIICKTKKSASMERITTVNVNKEKEQIQSELNKKAIKKRKLNRLILIISSAAAAICILIGVLVGTLAPLQNVSVKGMTFEKSEEGYELISYNGSASTVTIPTKIRGLEVVEIGAYAFGYSQIKEVTIPESVTSIGRGAFNKCSELVSVTIGENVASIAKGCFKDCTALKKIQYNAVNCKDFTGGSQNDDNEVFYNAGKSGSGIQVIIGKNVKKVPAYLFYSYYPLYANDDLHIPKITSVEFENNSSCTAIGSYAFGSCRSLSNFTIPDSVTSISSSVFEGCSSLISIKIPNSVVSIGSYAFRGCKKVTLYAEATSQPSGWSLNWNINNYPVVWGYKG